jgi:hypothetical protein
MSSFDPTTIIMVSSTYWRWVTPPPNNNMPYHTRDEIQNLCKGINCGVKEKGDMGSPYLTLEDGLIYGPNSPFIFIVVLPLMTNCMI